MLTFKTQFKIEILVMFTGMAQKVLLGCLRLFTYMIVDNILQILT
jgi:hypothetical protein